MTVRRNVIFQSTAFNTSEPKDYFINDCCYGDDLARWLMEQLRACEIHTDSEPGQEDFGWYFTFHVAESDYDFIISYRPAEEGQTGDWMCSIERETGFVGWICHWSRKRGIQPDAPKAIHSILSSSPKISNVRWFTDEDFEREENGNTTATTV